MFILDKFLFILYRFLIIYVAIYYKNLLKFPLYFSILHKLVAMKL